MSSSESGQVTGRHDKDFREPGRKPRHELGCANADAVLFDDHGHVCGHRGLPDTDHHDAQAGHELTQTHGQMSC